MYEINFSVACILSMCNFNVLSLNLFSLLYLCHCLTQNLYCLKTYIIAFLEKLVSKLYLE